MIPHLIVKNSISNGKWSLSGFLRRLSRVSKSESDKIDTSIITYQIFRIESLNYWARS